MGQEISRYKAAKTRLTVLLNRGFDYRGRLLLRNTDPNLYKNDRLRGFAIKLEEIINEWFYQAKRIKTFRNFHVDADSDDIM